MLGAGLYAAGVRLIIVYTNGFSDLFRAIRCLWVKGILDIAWSWGCSFHCHIGFHKGHCLGVEVVHNIVISVSIKAVVL